MSLCRYDTSKPCENNGTSSRTCIDCILNKIRAEIEYHRRKTQSIDPYDLVGDCLDIINKYKAEARKYENHKEVSIS